jgi:FkbM family methyltransferase
MKQVFTLGSPLQIVDIGASDIEDKPVYEPLMTEGLGALIGFEPSPDMFEKLKDLMTKNQRYLPYALGDGTEQTLKICRAPGMTSLLEPDMEHLEHFHGFDDWAVVEERLAIQTHRLDDIEEIGDIDFIKIDTQGAEHQIIEAGQEKISNAVAMHVELSFKPIYHGEKSFAEVDLLMNKMGFSLHTMAQINRRAFRPMMFNNSIFDGLHHILQVDAVYIKDFQKFGDLSAEKLLKLATVLHYCYGSFDAAMLALRHYDDKSSTDFANIYAQGLR